MKKTEISFVLNGKEVHYGDNPLRRLLDVLREDFSYTGTKEGCGEGECGACSVFIDGELANSCLVPMGTLVGKEVVTIEGLRETERGKCLIEAFEEGGAVQCGFCTPGMVMAADAVLRKNPRPSEEEIRKGLSGNLCRCTGYDHIVNSVLLAVEKGRGLW